MAAKREEIIAQAHARAYEAVRDGDAISYTVEPRPMVYHNKWLPTAEVLADGAYAGHRFIIKNFGMWPTAYVQLNDLDYGFHTKIDTFDLRLEAHGGITYNDKCLYVGADLQMGKWIGWDYAHHGDYTGNLVYGGKRWTTEEILEDCICVIEQVMNL